MSSFRPDGADCSSPEFAEALKLAHEDRELGQWLANERSFDGAFAAAFAEVTLPVALCKNILTGFAIEHGEIPRAEDALDSAMIGALASLQPPASLRGVVLAAMQCSVSPERRLRVFFWRRAGVGLALAAGIALAFFITRRVETPAIVRSTSLPVEVVEAGFIRAFESPLFSLDEKRDDQRVLITHLKEQELPCPCCLPRGLTDVKGIGCRQLVIDGKSGSLICFDEKDNGVVHLVTFRREDVEGELPLRHSPELSQHGRWSVARWTHNGKVFVLLGNSTDVVKLASLF